MKAFLRFVIVCVLIGRLLTLPVSAQPTPPVNVGLTVNRTTGVIVGPVSAQTFKTNNNLGSGAGGSSYIFSSPLVDNSGTVSINNAAADGTTKGAAAFSAADFNASSGVIAIDYTNGQVATASVPGFLSVADRTAFNAKLGTTAIGVSVQAFSANLLTYAGITPSANVQTLLGGANYAAIKTSLSLNLVDNESSANLRDRSTHTGAQAISTVTGLQAALDLKAGFAALVAVNGSGVNVGGLVDWSQLMNVPAGFADGLDDGGGGGGSGTVTSFSAGDIAGFFTTAEATPTVTPALTFTLATAAVNTVWSGPVTGGATTPTYRLLVAADIPPLPLSKLTTDPLARANHTGAQAISTVTGLQTSLNGKAATGTTVGTAILNLADPSAITFLRLNGDNSATALAAETYRAALGIDDHEAHGAIGATEAFTALTSWHSVTLDANTTFSFTNWPANTTARTIVLEILQDATGSRTITWPAAVVSTPTVATAANAITLVSLSSRNGGATIFAQSTAEAGGSGSGTVTASGPPVSGQIAQWTSATNLQGIPGASPFAALTDGATITWAAVNGYAQQNASVTLAGNRTLAITGLANGMAGTLKVIQDGTGSRTLTLPEASRVQSNGAGVITLTSTAGAVDKLTWCYDGTYLYWDAPKLNYTPGTDVTPPTLTSATIGTNGTTFTFVFSEAVKAGAGGSGGFVPTLTLGADTLTYSSGTGTATLVYNGSRTVSDTETGTLAFTQPTNGIEDDPAGNDMATFSGTTIVNNSTQTGGAAWHESVAPGSTDETQSASLAGQIWGGVVVPSASGTVTKAAVYFSNVYEATAFKIALLTTSGVVIGSGTVTPTVGTNRWEEVTFTGAAVTASTSYVVMHIVQGGTASARSDLNGAGGGYENYDQVYSTFPSGTVSLNANTHKTCVRIYVTP